MSAKGGRKTKYTEALADEICERLAAGESLNSICHDAHMPDENRVRRWAINDQADKDGTGAGFKAKYTYAREIGYDRMADEIIAISDADYSMPDGLVDNAAIQQARLRSDNRKWLLSKVMPKRYGDRITQEITGDPDAPLVTRIELVPVASVVTRLVPRTLNATPMLSDEEE